MEDSTAYVLAAMVWLVIGVTNAFVQSGRRARFDRALSLKYPRTSPDRGAASGLRWSLLYLVAGPLGIQATLMDNRRDLVGDYYWNAAG